MKLGSTYTITWTGTDGDVEVSISRDGVDGSYTLIDTVTTAFDIEDVDQEFTLDWVVEGAKSTNCYFKFEEVTSGWIFYSGRFTINSGQIIFKNKVKVGCKVGLI